MRLSIGNSAFPLLSIEQSIQLGGLLDFDGFDVVLNGNSAGLRPEAVMHHLGPWADTVNRLLDEQGMVAADVFCVPWTDFVTMAPNHPDVSERVRSRLLFRQMLDLASAIGAPGVTMLPGVDWPDEHHEVSLQRAADELQARAEEAADLGLGFSIEAHVGSVCHDPADVLQLCELAPALALTLDYTHFVSQGIAEADIDPLARRRAPCADPRCRRRSPAGSAARFVAQLRADGRRAAATSDYDGFITVEYIWVAWKRLNEVDVVSETVMLRDRLRAKFRDEPWTAPGPTGITEG